MPVPRIGCQVFAPPTCTPTEGEPVIFCGSPSEKTVSNVISTIVVNITPFLSVRRLIIHRDCFCGFVDVFREKVTLYFCD